MIKTYKNNSISFVLKMLTVFAFALVFLPFHKVAANDYYGQNITYNTANDDADNYFSDNPVPSISSLSPSSANMNSGSRAITITGNGFVPSSIARVNGSDRTTTFIDSNHLLVELRGSDLNQSNGLYITVWNGLPGGGYSDSSYFTINNVATPAYNTSNSNNTNTSSYSNTTNTQTQNSTNGSDTNNSDTSNTSTDNASNLASNAIFGSNGFLPSGIIQWILFAIFVLLVIILVRRIFGARERYEEEPLKHA